MIFEILTESAERDELILVEGGMCHFHLRKDGQLTIREILVLPQFRRRGVGAHMLNCLRMFNPTKTTSIFAKCPFDLVDANAWYLAMGFKLEAKEVSKSGRVLWCWRLSLP